MFDFELISEFNNRRGFGPRFPHYPWENFDAACISTDQFGGRRGLVVSDTVDAFWPIPVGRGLNQDLAMYERQLAVVEARLATRQGTRMNRRLDRLDRQRLRSYVAQLRGTPGSIPPEAGEEYETWVRGLRSGEWKSRIASPEDTIRTLRAFERHAAAEREADALGRRQRIAAGYRQYFSGKENDPARLP